MKRQGRAERRRGVRVRLTKRDQALLQALRRFRVARTGDLVRLAFSGVRPDTAAVRLRKLFDAGYLAVSSQSLTKENVYHLGPEGRQWIRGQGQDAASVPRGNQEHHLAIVRTWIDLALVARDVPWLRLVSVRPDWEIRFDLAGSGALIVPDLLVRLERPHQDGKSEAIHLAVEVDLGTERLPVVRRKLSGYALEAGAEVPSMVLAVVHGRQHLARRVAIEDLLSAHWPGPWLSWSLSEGPGSAIRSLAEGEFPPLAGSPYGKGRLVAGNDEVSTEAYARGGRSFQGSGAQQVARTQHPRRRS